MPEDPNLPPQTDPVPPVTTPPAEPVTPPTPPVDYEKKFSESSRENQLLQERIRSLEAAGQDLTKEPTDSDLKAAFPEWDGLDDFQKGVARRAYNAERIAGASAQKADALASERSWNTSIELAVSSNPSLQGKEQAFRQFAQKPQYRNVPMDLLVDTFLQRNPSAPPTTTPRPGLEPGNGGPRTPDKPQQISADDLALLRKTDEKAYMEYVKTHEIDVDKLS